MIFLSRVSVAYLSLQYLNSMKCMVISGVGFSLGGCDYMDVLGCRVCMV